MYQLSQTYEGEAGAVEQGAARAQAPRRVMSLPAGVQDHRGGSARFSILEGFLEKVSLEVSSLDKVRIKSQDTVG